MDLGSANCGTGVRLAVAGSDVAVGKQLVPHVKTKFQAAVCPETMFHSKRNLFMPRPAQEKTRKSLPHILIANKIIPSLTEIHFNV
jgi:hypothetical protein